MVDQSVFEKVNLALICAILSATLASTTAFAEINAYVAAQTAIPEQRDATYHLLLNAESGGVSTVISEQIESEINRTLHNHGLVDTAQLLEADTVILVRLGLLDRFPSPDAVLAGANPDEPLAEGRAYVRVEAYATKAMTEFSIAAGDQAAEDSLLDFIVWETAVEANVMRQNFSRVLPSLGHIAADHMLTNTHGTFILTN